MYGPVGHGLEATKFGYTCQTEIDLEWRSLGTDQSESVQKWRRQ